MENTFSGINFVGIDAHSKNSSIKAINMQGEAVLELDVPTYREHLQKALGLVPPPAWVMLESSFIAAFVKECIEDKVHRVIVCETRENRWIARSENKSDQADADRLARLLRMGEYKEVYVPKGIVRDRREVLSLYTKCQGDVARTKNRIKAKFREHGVRVDGTKVYGPKRDIFISQIHSLPVRNALLVLYKKLDSDETATQEVLANLVRLVKDTREYKLLKTLPGIAKIRAATLATIIDDPHRFENKRRLWSYAGLGLSSRWSSNPDRAQVRGSKMGNRLLKHTAISAAKTAIGCDNRFSRSHQQMLSSGMKESNAVRTVARQILAAALVMLKNGEEYRDKQPE